MTTGLVTRIVRWRAGNVPKRLISLRCFGLAKERSIDGVRPEARYACMTTTNELSREPIKALGEDASLAPRIPAE